MYAHYADIISIDGLIVLIKDRVNNNELIIEIEKDEKKFIEKCKYVKIEFLKKKI